MDNLNNESGTKFTDIVEYKSKLDREEARAQRFRRRRIKRIVVLACVVAAIVMIVVMRDNITASNFRMITSSISAAVRGEDLSVINFGYDSKNQYVFYKGRLAVASPDGVVLSRAASESKITLPLSYSNMRIDANDKFLLAYDYKGQSFGVVSGEDVAQSASVNGTILSARLSKGSGYSIISKTIGYRSVITVYGNNHQERYKYYAAKNWVIDAHVSPNGSKMAAIYIDTQGEGLVGGVSLFEFSKDEPVARFTIDGEIPLAVEYKDNNLICVLHTGGLLFLRSNGEEFGSFSFDGAEPYAADLSASSYAVVLAGADAMGGSGTLYIVNNSGKVIGTYRPSEDVKKVLTTRSNVILYTDNKIILLDTSGQERKAVELEPNVRDIIMTQSKEIYAIGIEHAKKIKY